MKKNNPSDKSSKKEFKFNEPFKPRIPKTKSISTSYFLLLVVFSLLAYYLFWHIDIDRILVAALVALAGIGIEMFSHIFTYILTLIQSIPFVGPIVARVITWPIFVTLNVVAYFVSLVVIRFKGMAMVKDARILTTIFLIGLLLGFILGRLF